MEVIQDEHYFYTLSRDEKTGEYFLEALCGTVAIFNITIKLTKKEISDFERDPISIRVLAQKMTDSPNSFLHRRV